MVGVKAAGAWATGFLERRANLVLAGCVLATLAAGLVATVALGDQIRFVDEAQYLAIGRSIADHGQIHLFGHPSAYRTPGWPAVIAVVDLLGGGRPVVRFLNFVFEAGAIAGVYALTRTFASGAAAALAALLMAAYPFAVYTATTFYPQTMAAALVPVSLLALVRATETEGRTRLLWASAAGAGFAGTTLTVPTFAYLTPLALVWLAFTRRQALVSIGAPIIVVVGLVIGAWTVRNALTMNAFVPLASSSGYNLLVGNHPGANATTGSEPRVMNPYLRAARRRDLSELEANAFFAEIARNWISRHKAEAAKLYLAKVANNFNWTNKLATKGANSPLMSLIGAITYLPLLALLVLRLALRAYAGRSYVAQVESPW